jgi:adhesin transport system outer membrane protein
LKSFFKITTPLLFLITSSLAYGSTSNSLDVLIREALSSYPSILSRQATKDGATSDLTAAKLKFLPNPSFNTQRNQVSFDGGTSASQMPSSNITISQPLLIDGGVIAGYNKADAKLNVADFALLETREEIGRRVVTSYAEWLKAWLKIQALEDSIKVHEQLVSLITRRYEQGVASRADRDLGLSRLYQSRADLQAQNSQESTMLTALSELTGSQVTRQQLIKQLPQVAPIPSRKDGILRALNISVTIQRSFFEAKATDYEAKEIRAQALPQLSLQAQRQIGNAYFPGAQGFNSVGLVLSITPGGGFSTVATASAAVDRARASTIQVETFKRDLTERLNAEYNEFEFSKLKKESLSASAALASEISSSYDRQYLVGRKSWLDSMNAVRELAQTRMQLADAEGSLIGSTHRLKIYVEGTKQFDTFQSR